MKLNIRFIAESAVIAALYAALTWAFSPIAYGAVQFRISEILVLLVVLQPKFAFAIVIGCFVANTTSSLGWYDMVFGTLATLLAVLPMIKIKKIALAALFPVISNAVIVAIELFLVFEEPIWLSMLTVGLGEAVVLYFVGLPVISILLKNQELVRLMDLDSTIRVPNFSLEQCSVFVLGAVGSIFYIAYPLTQGGSPLSLTQEFPWMVLYLIFSIGLALTSVFDKRTVLLLICWLGLTALYTLTGICALEQAQYGYYYAYSIYLLIVFAVIVFLFLRRKTEAK